MMEDKILKALISVDHASLLLILPFECGYCAHDDNPNIANNAALNLAMLIQHINHAIDPSLALKEAPIN
jgi:hypothetical protein